MDTVSNILIIDDVPQNLQVLGNILKKHGYNVLAALNGKAGLNILSESKRTIHLILLDVSMPGMSGFDVCHHIKQNTKTKHIPIIFLTAYNESKDIIKGFQAGGNDYITKPFQTEELIARIKTQLVVRQQHDLICEQNQELSELNNVKDTLFSIIGHDLRNIFNVIMGLSQVLSEHFEEYDNAKNKDFIDSIYSSAISAEKLLENLLIWSRFQRKMLNANIQSINLKSQIKWAISISEGSASQKEITIRNLVEKNVYVYGDSNMLGTILRNLISNAIKFSKKQDVITISSSKIKENSLIEIAISDTGVGIAPNRIDTIFKIEKDKSTTGTNNEKGTGLGLVLCKEFVELQGGTIWVESKLHKGSTFKFTLPTD